jgi:excisionase family DNA binding protein
MTQSQLADELKQIREHLQEQSPRPLTLAEAAVYLNISRSHLYFLTSQSLIPHFKPSGKKIYFTKGDLDAYLLRHRVASRSEIVDQVADASQ